MRIHPHPAIPALLALLLLAGCSAPPRMPGGADGAPARRLDPDRIADAVPRDEPRSRYGNPASYQVLGKRYRVMKQSRGYVERGIASWYGTKFHGRRTSSGEPYDMYAMTAAHKTLPLPTYVEVRNLDNGRSAIVKVNDRGPFHPNRIIDLSYAAATKLGILGKGTGLVEIRAIDPRRPQAPRAAAVKQAAERETPPRMYIQAGAFSIEDNARRRMRRLLESLQTPVRLQMVERDGRSIYRVRIGPVADVEQADRITERLARIGVTNSHVVIE
ncbi:MAG TPA: septal ring lytic transglycosylase RlpA family protein [Sedimenticola thiotaurini]|uniref:Endolytic peptidoglycan transglycosylase RlpA n=1 Tax=Sedimenticola thiotaurini TaxID=1543721 RepID=A0A831RNX5_9GAMM|nr:septal ring lytic transglycosylase RlpA family protein [Sedimenticola thiotaurini]